MGNNERKQRRTSEPDAHNTESNRVAARGEGGQLGEEGEGMGKYGLIATGQSQGCTVQRQEQSRYDWSNWTVLGGYQKY